MVDKRTLTVGYGANTIDCNLTMTNFWDCPPEKRLLHMKLLLFSIGSRYEEVTFRPAEPDDMLTGLVDMYINRVWGPEAANLTMVLPLFVEPIVAIFAPRQLQHKAHDHGYLLSPFEVPVWLLFVSVWLGLFVPLFSGPFRKLRLKFALSMIALQVMYSAVLKGNRSSFRLEPVPFVTTQGMHQSLLANKSVAFLETPGNTAFNEFARAVPQVFSRNAKRNITAYINKSYLDTLLQVYERTTKQKEYFAIRYRGYATLCGFEEIKLRGMVQRYFGLQLPRWSPLISVVSNHMPAVVAVFEQELHRIEIIESSACRKYVPQDSAASPVVHPMSIISLQDGLTTIIAPLYLTACVVSLVELVRGWNIWHLEKPSEAPRCHPAY